MTWHVKSDSARLEIGLSLTLTRGCLAVWQPLDQLLTRDAVCVHDGISKDLRC